MTGFVNLYRQGRVACTHHLVAYWPRLPDRRRRLKEVKNDYPTVQQPPTAVPSQRTRFSRLTSENASFLLMVRPRIKEWNPLVLCSQCHLFLLFLDLCTCASAIPLGQCNLIHLCIWLKRPRQWIEDQITTSLPCLYKPPESSNVQTRLISPHSLIYAPLERSADAFCSFVLYLSYP